MEARLAQQLELTDVVEAVELVDEARVRSGGDDSASVLVVVQEMHPLPVELPPVVLVLAGPVEPVGPVSPAAGLVEVLLRRERVLLVEVRLAGAHDVAAGFVDGHRRVEPEAQLQELIDQLLPLLASGLCGLEPEAPHVAEAVLLVVVVVVEWPGLDGVVGEHGLEEPVVVCHHVQPHARRVDRGHACHAHLVEVGDGLQVEPVRLVDEGGHDLGVVRAQLQAVDGLAFDFLRCGPLHPLARGFRGVDRASAPALAAAGPHIRVHVGRDDGVVGRHRLLAQLPLEPPMGHAARRGDPVSQPELVDVLALRGLGGAPGVGVHVHEAGEQEHPLAVDLVIARIRTAVLVDLHQREADRGHLNDAIVLDDHVHRPAGRRAGAIDDRDAPDDHAVEGPLAFVGSARGGRFHLALGDGGGRSQEHCQGAEQGKCKGTSRQPTVGHGILRDEQVAQRRPQSRESGGEGRTRQIDDFRSRGRVRLLPRVPVGDLQAIVIFRQQGLAGRPEVLSNRDGLRRTNHRGG